jgi:hypothetical protein
MRILHKLAFIGANAIVMIILHGNSRQWWPKIPYLSLRDESVTEHQRLLFNTFAIVTIGQALLGRLPRNAWLARALTTIGFPLALPALIWAGPQIFRLRGAAIERYNLAMVPLLPIVATIVEDALTERGGEESGARSQESGVRSQNEGP